MYVIVPSTNLNFGGGPEGDFEAKLVERLHVHGHGAHRCCRNRCGRRCWIALHLKNEPVKRPALRCA